MARNRDIADYDQYAHLRLLADAALDYPGLAAILGSDYTITPDVVVFRGLESDEAINRNDILVGDHISSHATIRASNGGSSILHASISCKYSIRSDRSQNSRSEALNLIRNRKGRAPHIVVVTCEPMPSRIGSIALGTGDIDCVYHFALPELVESVAELGFEDAADSLQVMIEGKRFATSETCPSTSPCVLDMSTKGQRSMGLSRVRGEDMKPETVARRMLHSVSHRHGLYSTFCPADPISSSLAIGRLRSFTAVS